MIWDALQGLPVNLIDERVPGFAGRTFRPVATLVHHTAAPEYTGNAPSLNVCKYGRGKPGDDNYLPGPLCQVLIGRQGEVFVITDGYANHAGVVDYPYSNSNLVGVEIENNGVGESYGPGTMHAARLVCDRLTDAFGQRIYGHKEICLPRGRKIDPSFDMDAFRASLVLTDEGARSVATEDQINDIHFATVGARRFANPTAPPYADIATLVENINHYVSVVLPAAIAAVDSDQDAQYAAVIAHIQALTTTPGPDGTFPTVDDVLDALAARLQS